jgi:hypothetical protein
VVQERGSFQGRNCTWLKLYTKLNVQGKNFLKLSMINTSWLLIQTKRVKVCFLVERI